MHKALFGLFGFNKAQLTPACAWPLQGLGQEATCSWTAACGTHLTLRAVRPADAALLGEFFEDGLSSLARYSRFHGAMGRLSAARLAWMAEADFKRHAAFIVTRTEDGLEHAIAEGRWVRTAVNPGAEFALSVGDAWQGRGIGQRLLAALVQAGREEGLPCLLGDVLPSNRAMASLALSQGFECVPHPEEAGLLRAELRLTAPSRARVNVFTAFTTAAWLH